MRVLTQKYYRVYRQRHRVIGGRRLRIYASPAELLRAAINIDIHLCSDIRKVSAIRTYKQWYEYRTYKYIHVYRNLTELATCYVTIW